MDTHKAALRWMIILVFSGFYRKAFGYLTTKPLEDQGVLSLEWSGDSRSRTDDLLHAMQAL